MELSRIRGQLGIPPRECHWSIPAPAALPWVSGDPIEAIWDNADAVMRNGEVVWGMIYMANTTLFEPGSNDAPAGIVYSFDPSILAAPTVLYAIGSRLYDLHERDEDSPVVRPWHRWVADQVHSGFERPFHHRLPPEITGGPVVYHGTVMVFRDHLAHGHLIQTLVPVLVHPPYVLLCPQERQDAP